ncbi:MAG TPA: cytochrome c peroxidase, partial [Acetobacteraceae bacterium]|nr:cytochrome c peroxidase [Acetobacteraceae bacterium]
DTIPIPGPETDLSFKDLKAAGIVKDEDALIRLGKALFWDMQVGSDGVQSCATCHFSAGADNRTRNQISPGLNDTNFQNTFIAGDNSFGDSTVPYTANDRNTPVPPGPVQPPPANLNVPGFRHFNPNHQLTAKDFPLNGWLRPTERTPRGGNTTLLDESANVSRDTNDVISSQGVRHTIFAGLDPGKAVEKGTEEPDIYNLANPGKVDVHDRVRRAEARNAPTVINAIFNFDNFWEGRASYIFNGLNPFGFRDRTSTLIQNSNGKPREVFLRITNSSLASQAVGPPASNFEMSFENGSHPGNPQKIFPDYGKKLLGLRPLQQQFVHPQDSVLGGMSRATLDAGGNFRGDQGLKIGTYEQMIKDAFSEDWWSSDAVISSDTGTVARQDATTNNPRTMFRNSGNAQVTARAANAPAALKPNEYSQMMWNFSLFFGLAVQAYEATLVSDDTPFDRYEGAPTKGIKADPNALNESERHGLSIFMDDDPNLGAHCNACHAAPVMTNHTIADIVQQDSNLPNFQGRPRDILEFMVMGDGQSATYDKGFYNISVRRTTEDIARAGTAPSAPDPDHPTAPDLAHRKQSPFANPKDDYQPFPLSYTALAGLAAQNKLPDDVLRFIQLDPATKKPVPVRGRQAIHGNFKAPNLRNVHYTGPYFHNGDSATLRQVVEFYTRGGNFPNTNFHDLDVDIFGIPGLRFPEFVPSAKKNIQDLVNFLSHGLTDQRVVYESAPFDHPQLFVPNGASDHDPNADVMLEVPAVGKFGRTTPISTFLDLDPQAP